MPAANAPSSKYAEGIQFFKNEEWDKALKEFDAAIKDNYSEVQKALISLLSAYCQIEHKKNKEDRIECKDDKNFTYKPLEDIERHFETDEILEPNLVDIYNSLGLAYIKLSKYEEAEIWFSKALNVHRKQEDLPLALLQQNLGGCYFLLERFENGILWNDKAISTLYGLKEKRAKIHCLLNQGRCYMKIKRWKSSLFCYKEAVRIAESGGLDNEKKKALDEIADCYEEMGECEQPVETSEKILKLPVDSQKKIEVEKKLRDTGKDELKEKRAKIHCLLNQGRCYMKIKHWKSSLFHYKDAVRIAESEGLDDEKEKALDGLADCYKEMGDSEQAVETYGKILKVTKDNEKKIEVDKKLMDAGKEIINKETNSYAEPDSDSENSSDKLSEEGVKSIICSIL